MEPCDAEGMVSFVLGWKRVRAATAALSCARICLAFASSTDANQHTKVSLSWFCCCFNVQLSNRWASRRDTTKGSLAYNRNSSLLSETRLFSRSYWPPVEISHVLQHSYFAKLEGDSLDWPELSHSSIVLTMHLRQNYSWYYRPHPTSCWSFLVGKLPTQFCTSGCDRLMWGWLLVLTTALPQEHAGK